MAHDSALDKKTVEMSAFLLELSLLDVASTRVTPSVLATAAVGVARDALCLPAGGEVDVNVASMIHSLHKSFSASSLKAVVKKYSTADRCAVSRIPPRM